MSQYVDLNALRTSQPDTMRYADQAGRFGNAHAAMFFMKLAVERQLRRERMRNAPRPWEGTRLRSGDSTCEAASLWIGSADHVDASSCVVGTILDWTPPEPPEE